MPRKVIADLWIAFVVRLHASAFACEVVSGDIFVLLWTMPPMRAMRLTLGPGTSATGKSVQCESAEIRLAVQMTSLFAPWMCLIEMR